MARPAAPGSEDAARWLVPMVAALIVLAHLETALPEALRPLARPEMASLPGPLAVLAGVPSPDRPYFARVAPDPAVLILKALGTGVLVAWLGAFWLLPAARARRFLLYAGSGLLVAILYAVPALVPIVARHRTGEPAFAHDGGTIQIEEACRMLARGENPYVRDYRGTPLEKWRGLETPIVDHLPYFPWAVLPLVPVDALLQAVGRPDLRFAYHGIAVILALALAWPARRTDAGPVLVLLPFFTPYLAKATILGTNDLYAIAWVVAAVLLLEAGRLRPGLVALGLAMAVKQFCWLIVPMLLARHLARPERRALLLLPFLAFAVVTLPFLAWAPWSFLDDTFGYGLGGSSTAHPIKGVGSYGLGTLALAFGLVRRATDPFPATLIGAALAVAVTAVATRRQLARAPASEMLALFALALLPLLYFARYFHANFLGYALFFLLWAALWPERPADDREGSGSASPV